MAKVFSVSTQTANIEDVITLTVLQVSCQTIVPLVIGRYKWESLQSPLLHARMARAKYISKK
jgi:hypothetical protein